MGVCPNFNLEPRNYMPLLKNIALMTPGKIHLAVLPVLLAAISLPAQTNFIDSFAVGPQSYHIGPGDASAGGSVSGLDTNQVVWGSRSFTIYADQKGCGFRQLDGGDISVSVNASTPGTLNVAVAELASPGDSDYAPWIYLSYQSSGAAADWSDCDRMVITFSTPPTTDMLLQTYVTTDITTWYAGITVAAGTKSVVILFSDLVPTDTPFTGSNVLSCSFSFSPPMDELFAISSILVIKGSPGPSLPCLNAARCTEGLQLTWPTNRHGICPPAHDGHDAGFRCGHERAGRGGNELFRNAALRLPGGVLLPETQPVASSVNPVARHCKEPVDVSPSPVAGARTSGRWRLP